MVLLHENIVGLDAAIFMHPTVWKASGHVDAFNDPLIDNRDSKKRYRADVLIEDHMAKYEEKIAKEIAKARSVSAIALMRLSSVQLILAFWRTRRSLMISMPAILRLCRVLTWKC